MMHNEKPLPLTDIEHREAIVESNDPMIIAARLTTMQLMMWRGRFAASESGQAESIEAEYYPAEDRRITVSSPSSRQVTLSKSDQDGTTWYMFDSGANMPITAQRQNNDQSLVEIDTSPETLYPEALRILFDANHIEQTG